jgi:hypothetical protein
VWAWAYGNTWKEEDRKAMRDAIDQAERPRVVVRREDRGKPHHPGTAPPGIPMPSWYKGDKGAFNSSVRAGIELNEPAALGV